MTRNEAVVEAAQREAREGVHYIVAYQWVHGAADPPSEGYYTQPVLVRPEPKSAVELQDIKDRYDLEAHNGEHI